jgi:glycogen operon protein
VEGIKEGQIYAYQVDGPYDPKAGHRFNRCKVLIDPYSLGVVYGANWSRSDCIHASPNYQSSMKSLIVDPLRYDWQGVTKPRIHPSDTIIYELHVRGYTKHPTSQVRYPGTFDGLVEKIPYLKDLGITTVELLPIHQFDPDEVDLINPVTGERLKNFWGYSSICFFAPHRGYYIADWQNMEYLTGFRDLIRAMHRAGLEVILDVVFNHTSEGDQRGPTVCFRGFENSVYYLLDSNNRKTYLNYSGCGNTVNCNHPIVRRMILDSLRYWVDVMHVDGFRFDLASVLARDENGNPMNNPPLLWEIESDPILQRTRVIAEAWDAAGLYQVGVFPGERWAEWNGKYRDDIRKFVRGDNGMAGAAAARITGSGDLYAHLHRHPAQSINFITSHDGFTLSDLVSYSHKHNFENGEQNRDGSNDNHSANYGSEGPTEEESIKRIRLRQMKNFLAILLLSQGTPMILAGDEFGRSQKGNNNAYCQDNEISWVDWSQLEKNTEIFRFCQQMIRFRKRHRLLRKKEYFYGAVTNRGIPEITWHGVKLYQPDWSYHSHTIAFTLAADAPEDYLHIMMNFWIEPLLFEVPSLPAEFHWYRAIDTFQASPEDIIETPQIPFTASNYVLRDRSICVLEANLEQQDVSPNIDS